MRRSLSIIFLLSVSLLNSGSFAALSLNPIDWFRPDEPEIQPLADEIDRETANTWFEKAKAKYDAGSEWSAMRQLKKLIKEYPDTPAAARALALRAEVFMEQGKWTKAFDSYQTIARKHPTYENYNQLIGNQFICATALMEGARGKLLWVIPGFKQYGKAVTQFELIVINAPYSDYAPLALMNVALLGEKRNKPEEAIDALDRIITFYPQNMLASDAYFNLAKTYSSLVQGYHYDQGSTRQAISYYEDFLILYPTNSNVGEVEANVEAMENLLAKSRKTLGDFYYIHRNNNTAALVFYNEAITIAPESETAVEARKLIKDIDAGVRPVTGSSFLRKILTGK